MPTTLWERLFPAASGDPPSHDTRPEPRWDDPSTWEDLYDPPPPPPAPERFPRDDWSAKVDFEQPPYRLAPVRRGEVAIAAQRASRRWTAALAGEVPWAELGADGVALAAIDRAWQLKHFLHYADEYYERLPETTNAWVARTEPLVDRACTEAGAALPPEARHLIPAQLRDTVRRGMDVGYQRFINGTGTWPGPYPSFPRSALGRYALDDPNDPAHRMTVTVTDFVTTTRTLYRVSRDGVRTPVWGEGLSGPPVEGGSAGTEELDLGTDADAVRAPPPTAGLAALDVDDGN